MWFKGVWYVSRAAGSRRLDEGICTPEICIDLRPLPGVRLRWGGSLLGVGAGLAVLPVHASQTPLQEISPVVWVMVAISAAGAFITYAIMAYAAWRFRDPSTRGRNYG
ncbi:MAG: hypothetical protein L3K11_05820 [Thermoplasmata archaeon]|nr:hypothetical protein [Thermoplasmata archaeon]